MIDKNKTYIQYNEEENDIIVFYVEKSKYVVMVQKLFIYEIGDVYPTDQTFTCRKNPLAGPTRNTLAAARAVWVHNIHRRKYRQISFEDLKELVTDKNQN